MSPAVAIVITTRNRAGHAIAAIRSLLEIHDPRLAQVIVSNNSSEPGHVERLANYCAACADPRILHVRPPRALPMAEHWDWAIEQALHASNATHLGLHYDRRVSKPELARVFDIAELWPETPITYLLDTVYPSPKRFFVYPMPWSDRLFEIRTERALELAAQGRLTDLWQAFPVLVNCLVPRDALELVRTRFGDICASTSPESCFGFRFSAVAERYLHFDTSLGVHYGFALSNGMGYLRGETSGAFADFMELRGDRPWLEAAPLPGLSLGQNTFYHEYERVRGQDGGSKFPPIDMPGYLADLARGLPLLADPVRRADAAAQLVRHGWQPDGEATSHAPGHPRRLIDGLAAKWRRLRADYLRPRPIDLTTVGFKHEARALRAAINRPFPPRSPADFLAPLQPRRID